jgi:hypothetical protein
LLRIAPHIAWNNVEGELALFDSRDGTYHALNGSGAAIWRAIAAGLDERGIVDVLAAQFDAPRAAIAENLAEFIAAARAKGLLETPA